MIAVIAAATIRLIAMVTIVTITMTIIAVALIATIMVVRIPTHNLIIVILTNVGQKKRARSSLFLPFVKYINDF